MIINDNVKLITVNASKKYQVKIGGGLLKSAGEHVKEVVKASKIALVTDDTVDALYAKGVQKSLEENGFSVCKFVFPHGEQSKNLDTYGEILNFLAQNQITRTDALVALGGGVVGDMAGFAAATFLRGISYIQMPTTLLAQIDSSVGGKTAIDLKAGKNLVGAFCQPSLVLCDTDTLSSLTKEIFEDGMGETAKYAVLDKRIFDLLQNEDYDIKELVYLCVDYKRAIVEADEFEGGKRKLLNLGHTPAHAIEKLSGYQISHGKAVRMGLDIILNSSISHGLVEKKCAEQIKCAMDKCAKAQAVSYSVEQIAKACLADKKRSGDTVTFMMIGGVGNVIEKKVPITEIEGYLR